MTPIKHDLIFVTIFILSFSHTQGMFCTVAASPQPRASMVRDAFTPPDLPIVGRASLYPSSFAPDYCETSEYLIGNVTVGIVLLESNGTIDRSTEDWTPTEESNAIGKIQTALEWWASQNPSAHVSFKCDIHYRVPTRYEPINRRSSDECLWIQEAMAYFGYSGNYYFTQVRDYVNSLRIESNTKWSFAIFVVDSSSDPDGMFIDVPYFAYAYLGGPFLVMTYDNDGWGIGNMDRVAAHEMGHIFYATDEYDHITEYSGYLNVADIDGSGGIMDESNWYLSTGTRGQIGWRDSDGDGIQDIVDTFPNTILSAYSPDPTSDTTPTFTGCVAETPYPNSNPNGNSRDVTINTIANVEYRVDSGVWLKTSAADGLFNTDEEQFYFTLSLSQGIHLIAVRGMNSVGNVETAFATDTVTVDMTPPTTNLSYSHPGFVKDAILYASRQTNLTLEASDPCVSVASIYYKVDSGNWKQYVTPFDLSDDPDGAHRIYYYSIDSVGNKEATRSLDVIVDSTPPCISNVSPSNESASSSPFINISWTVLDDGSGLDHCEISIDEGGYIDIGLLTSHIFPNTDEGTHETHIKAIDQLGHEAFVSIILLIDTTPPSISITSPKNYAALLSMTATWNGSDTGSGVDHYEYKIDEQPWTNVEALTTCTAPLINDGTHMLTVKAIDKAGNSNVSSVLFVIDTMPPTVLIISPQNESEIRSSIVTVNWFGEDEISSIQLGRMRLDGESWIDLEANATHTFTQVGDGSHIVDIEAIDKAGNRKQTRIRFFVNTSLIGGPGWLDDAAVFGTTAIVISLAIGVFLAKARRRKRSSAAT